MASMGDVELPSHRYQVCAGLGKSPAETMELITSSETMNPCNVSVTYKWQEKFRNGRKSMEDDSKDGPPCVVKMTMKDITF